MLVHLLARLGCDEEVAATVAVQRTEQALGLNHFAQARHDRSRRFFLHQLRVVDLTGGIIENHDQVVPALIPKPPMFAAVNVQQHARHRPPFCWDWGSHHCP